MDRSNFYHGQVVMEDELDEVFDDVEDAERNLAIEGGVAQALAASTPNANALGGLMSGLGVTGVVGATEVSVATGVARDELGRRIALTHAATVLMSLEGACAEGVWNAASGDGALITGSCLAGQRIIATLFIAYDEDLSEQKTDALGVTLYYRITESFHFDIRIGAAFAHPPAGTPGRAALVDGKVALCDILLTNNAGTMQVVAVCNTSAEWDALGGNYANLDGRRGNVVALDQAADFPLFSALGDSIRVATAKEAIWALARRLQSAASPGSAVVSAAAAAGAITYPNDQTLNLTAGAVHDQLLAIQGAINGKLDRGGGFIVPQTGGLGPHITATEMDYQKYMLDLAPCLEVGPPAVADVAIGLTRRGIPQLPSFIWDDFMYRSNLAWNPDLETWNWNTLTGGGGGSLAATAIADTFPGRYSGIITMLTAGGAGDIIGIQSTGPLWIVNRFPWCTAAVRFLIPAPLPADAMFYFGFADNTDLSAATDYVLVQARTSVPDIRITTFGSGAGGASAVLLAPLVGDTWYTVGICTTGNNKAEVQLLSSPTTVPASVTLPGVVTFGAGPYYAMAEIQGIAAAAASAQVDFIYVGDVNNRMIRY